MRNILRSKNGQGTTEYIVIIAIIVVIAVLGIKTQMGQRISAAITAIGGKIDNAAQG